MKLVIGDGRVLTVYGVEPDAPLVRFRARAVPLKFHGHDLMTDDAARELVRAVRDSGLYEREL